MNPELHHKWNAERDGARGANKDGRRIAEEEVQQNRVLLKQSKPR
jgi:hypothetical protein